MATLDEIQKEYLEIIAEFERDDLTQEEMEALEARLDKVFGDKREKADAYARLILENHNRKDAIKKEAARLDARAKSAEKREVFLRGRFQAMLEASGDRKFEGNVYTLSLRASSYCDVVDESMIPSEWWDVKTTRTLAKSDILAAIKRGETVPGCRIGKRNSLQVK